MKSEVKEKLEGGGEGKARERKVRVGDESLMGLEGFFSARNYKAP